MYSTFHGLETARRGMSTQQAALHTTGHNIANANTEGYTRQRVNFSQTESFPGQGRNRPSVPGQLGTGVEADFIQRIRDNYLDVQYRGENSKLGYWDTKHASLEKIEDLMNEPSDDGIANTMDEFWTALQDLSTNPEDSGARSVVRQRGIALAETFNYTSDSLQANKKDLGAEITTTQDEVNSMLRQINNVNCQISRVEPHGDMPNDLYDERDRLLDNLSGMISIETERVESGGQPEAAAEGTMNVYLIGDDGERISALVDGENLDYKQLQVETAAGGSYHEYVESASFRWEGESADHIEDPDNAPEITFINSPGKLQGLVESFGYMDDGETSGIYPELLNNLDEMVTTFSARFNEVHNEGQGLNGSSDVDFFTFDENTLSQKGAAAALSISDEIKEDLDNIAASTNGYAGDGSNAQALSDVKDEDLTFAGTTTDVQGFYQGVIGDLAVETSEAERMAGNTDNLRSSVDSRRQEVGSVSLDEEMTNMIQFQHAYNASARNITMVDEMLDRIINNMGIVGR
ncbi:flagellar hook-associated protein FlgK [Alteribacillus sp. HJP-4]|uniref:flagellar hook-associated protein FlgK n=1 Tax=Alteribacillus sp. HJP-4 TaxID=2775394 RepID=UPI0035CCDB1E